MSVKKLLIISLILLSSCASLPPMPKGDLCTHYYQEGILLCSRIADGKDTMNIPIDETDKYIMISPKTWENIMNYIGKIKELAQRHCS